MAANGGEVLVDTLRAHGVEAVFFVAGGTYTNVLRALSGEPAMRCVPMRLESSAAFAAEAWGALRRRPACVLVSRAPGAANAAIGVHTAMQASRPLVLFVADIPRRLRQREAFQEIDYRLMYAPVAKAVLEVPTFERIAEVAARALDLSVSGRPGPVVVAIPRDLLDAEGEAPPVPPPAAPARAGPDPGALADLAAALAGARRPLLLAGEMVAFERAHEALVRLAEASGAGVLAAYRQQDVFPNDHPAWLGQLTLNRAAHHERALAECDRLIALGSRLDSVTAGDYALPAAHHRLAMVHPEPSVLAAPRPEIALASHCAPVLEALARAAAGGAPDPERIAWRDGLHAEERAFATRGSVPVHGAVDLGAVIEAFRARAPADSIVVSDAGTFGRWLHRYHPHTVPDTSLGPISGAMGYGLPAGIGAALAAPGRQVFVWVGDGGFQMTGHEAATLVQEGLAVKVLVCDNGVWGSILVDQHRRYPGWDFGVRLRSPDFARLGEGYGMAAFAVAATAEFDAALAAALEHPGPALVHLRLDPRDVSPFAPGARDAS